MKGGHINHDCTRSMCLCLSNAEKCAAYKSLNGNIGTCNLHAS